MVGCFSITKVAIGCIFRQSSILVTRRGADVHCADLWEFPGGKVAPNETVQQGLSRELQEELAIGVRAQQPLIQLQHDYGDRVIHCYAWAVRRYSGRPRPQEGQQMRWVTIEGLAQLAMPVANQPIVALLLQGAHSSADKHPAVVRSAAAELAESQLT